MGWGWDLGYVEFLLRKEMRGFLVVGWSWIEIKMNFKGKNGVFYGIFLGVCSGEGG